MSGPAEPEKQMNRRAFLCVATAIAAGPRLARAAGAARTIRIGWLTAQREASLAPNLAAMRRGFGELGYVEGRNLSIDYRFADDQLDRVAGLADGLVKAGVELIIAQGSAVSIIAGQRLPVPVVYIFSGDPVEAGLADSLAHPRGNMTGVTQMAAELNSKRIEMLRDIVPGLRRVAIIANPQHHGVNLERANSEDAGRRLGIAIRYHPTATRPQLDDALKVINADADQAISIFSDGFAVQNRSAILEFAAAQKIPVIAGWSVFARSGAICSYGPSQSELYRKLASYVDRIARGAKPWELPIQQPSTFETIVNLKTARALGLQMPPALLASADEIIE